MATLEQLAELLDKVFEGDIDASGIAETSLLREDVGLNSIAMLYMAVAIEERFNVRLKNEDLPGLRTVGDVLRVIRARQSA